MLSSAFRTLSTSSLTRAAPLSKPFTRSLGVSAIMSAQRDPETASYSFNHTMLRVRDPKASIDFYTRILGMEKIAEHSGGDFTLFFLAYDHSNGKETLKEKEENRSRREGILELTWNHGTENDENFKGYASGNEEPGKGFGHTCIAVDDLDKACKRFSDLGVKFKKRPEDGKMRNIAFLYDPDGYWVEVIARK